MLLFRQKNNPLPVIDRGRINRVTTSIYQPLTKLTSAGEIHPHALTGAPDDTYFVQHHNSGMYFGNPLTLSHTCRKLSLLQGNLTLPITVIAEIIYLFYGFVKINLAVF